MTLNMIFIRIPAGFSAGTDKSIIKCTHKWKRLRVDKAITRCYLQLANVVSIEMCLLTWSLSINEQL